MVTRRGHPTSQRSPEAEAWCEARAVSNEEALAQLGVNDAYDIKARHQADYGYAYRVADSMDFDWGGEGNGQLLYHLCRQTKGGHLIETGVAYGWSSLAMLLAIVDQPDARLYSNDMPYFLNEDDDLVGCVIPYYLRKPWRLYRYADREGLPRMIRDGGRFSVAHYDSDKSAAGRLWAYPLLWDTLAPGGYLVSDDVGDNEAFRHFTEGLGRDPIVIRFYDNRVTKYVGVLRKPG